MSKSDENPGKVEADCCDPPHRDAELRRHAARLMHSSGRHPLEAKRNDEILMVARVEVYCPSPYCAR